MKKRVKIKKKVIIFMIFIICSSLIGFLLYKYNTSNIDTDIINKNLLVGKKEILKEKKVLESNNSNKAKMIKVYLNYIYEIMDYMVQIHEINDNLKEFLNAGNIEKIKEDELLKNEESINKISNEIKKLKNKYLNKVNGRDKDYLEKEINKIDIEKCLEFNSTIINYSKDLLSISKFLNNNKEYYMIDDGQILLFLKRKVFLEYEKVDTNKYLKYRLIDDKEGPIIKAGNVSTNVGVEINLSDKISCFDEVDEEVKCNIIGDYDINTEGNYSLKIEASDQSNNISSKEIVLAVVPVKKIEVSNKNPYYIEVIRNQNVVVVYGLDEKGEYTKIVKVFVCSVGLNNATPTGTFTTSDKYVWRELYGGVYGQYATRIVGSILFHSVPYYSENKGDIESEEFNKLGDAASMGCVRMTVEDVKWIYDNCPKGMTVKIYDGDLPNGVSKPNALKIDLDSPNKGWDPTDPDSNNPWR